MLIEPCHIRPGTPALLGRCCPFGDGTHGIKTLEITQHDRFEADVTLPIGTIIVDIPEALTATKTKRTQPDVVSIRTVAAIVLAMNVERVQMLTTPVKHDLKDGMELRQGGVAAAEESAPDERADLAQSDTQLIDIGQFRWLAHRGSVAQCTVLLKVSPRNLALSYAPKTPVNARHRRLIVDLAAQHRLPAMYSSRDFVDVGGLMAYGPSFAALFRRAATYVDKILKGAKPADLPVEQPMHFELVINMKTAQALGLVLPPTLLVQADEVIR
jgi:hypothetical protein